MQFSLLVLGSPYSSQSATTALRFAKAVLESGHTIHRIFFYNDGVYAGNRLISPPQDEINIPEQWQLLAQEYNLDLVICIASTLKRGIINQAESSRYEKDTDNIANYFEISGLGQLIDTGMQADRLITFGP